MSCKDAWVAWYLLIVKSVFLDGLEQTLRHRQTNLWQNLIRTNILPLTLAFSFLPVKSRSFTLNQNNQGGGEKVENARQIGKIRRIVGRGYTFLSEWNGRLLPALDSVYARESCGKINELSSTKRKLILYLAWHYLLTLRMIISISELSATQVGCKENKDTSVSLLIPLQGDVDVPAI